MVKPIYIIHHIDLLHLWQFDWNILNTNDHYIIFWWEDIPLGHFFSDEYQVPVDDKSWGDLVWKIICPAIHYYRSKKPLIDLPELTNESALYSENIVSYFQILFAEYMVMDKESALKISLVICTRNRPAFLKKCLEAIKLLEEQPYEIIVVDNAPDDLSSYQIVSAFKDVKYVLEPNIGLDYARNAGILSSTGDIVAFADDDVILHPLWVNQMVASFESPKTMAVTGIVFANQLDTIPQSIFEHYWSFNRGYIPQTYNLNYFLIPKEIHLPVWKFGAGANMAFRRHIFSALGMFDVRLDMGAAGCNGDSEFWYRLIAEGWDVYYNPLVIAYHSHRKDESGLKNQIFQYMRGFSCAMLIQYNRYHRKGELVHLFKRLPVYYYREFLNGVKGGFKKRQYTVIQEIGGYLSGLWYYMRNSHRKAFKVDFQEVKFLPLTVTNPLVSVIITAYNHARFLPDAIKSVIGQTYKNIELIVIDDGSTDEIATIIKDYPFVRYYFQKNQGLSAARNNGIKFSSGDYLAFLDADDWFYPDAIRINLSYFSKNSEVAFVAGNHDKVNENKTLLQKDQASIPEKDFYKHLLLGNFIGMHATVLYKREIFNYFQYDRNLRACEDYDLYLRIARMCPVYCHQEKIAAYRLHSSNMSGNFYLMAKQVKNVLKKHYQCLPVTGEFPFLKKGLSIWKDYYAREIIGGFFYPRAGVHYQLKLSDFLLAISARPWQFIKSFFNKALKQSIYYFKINVPSNLKKEYYKIFKKARYIPAVGDVNWGCIRNRSGRKISSDILQLSEIQRYYLDRALFEFLPLITGHVLIIIPAGISEIVNKVNSFHHEKTIIEMGDSSFRDLISTISPNYQDKPKFDTLIWLNALSWSSDPKNDLFDSIKLLKTGGSFLLTVDGVSSTNYSPTLPSSKFTFTGQLIQILLESKFDASTICIKTRGNVYAAAASLNYLKVKQSDYLMIDEVDPQIQLFISAKATQNLTNETKRII